MKNFATALFATFVFSHAFAGVSGLNELGLKLAAENARLSKGENFMVSPLSLHQALSIAANGTTHETRHKLEELFGSSLEMNNENSAALMQTLVPTQQKSFNKFVQLTKRNVVSVQNSIWRTNGKTDGRRFEFSEEFMALTLEYYQARSYVLDFRKEEAATAINRWADEATKGLVKNIIDAETLSPMLWAVMNAAYMEASWAKPFHAMEDAPNFKLLDKSEAEAPMIRGRQRISYARIQQGELASVPFSYTQGLDLKFVVFLPKKGADFKKSQAEFFSPAFFDTASKALASRSSQVLAHMIMPKFSFDTSVEMKKDQEFTKAMGLNFLFQKTADFSLMATPESLPSIVGLIKQNSRIELDEKGVKAAAVTIVGGIERTSMPVKPTVDFVVDRPFHFAIVEGGTNTILFTGSVVDPR